MRLRSVQLLFSVLLTTVAFACGGSQDDGSRDGAPVGGAPASGGMSGGRESVGGKSMMADADSEGGAGGTPASGGLGGQRQEPAAGLFLSATELERLKDRVGSDDGLFATQTDLLWGRAESALDDVADPFEMQNLSEIRFGWSEPADDVDDTLREATSKFEHQSDPIRTLALRYAITGDETYGSKARELMLEWAKRQTIVDLTQLHIDFENGSMDGMTEGFNSDRPWNFALDTIWQTYGLINVSDAYLLLKRNGYPLSDAEDAQLRDWLERLVAAVDTAFHSWTKWADHHPTSSSFERYRSDNHLSWAMAGLLAGAAALGDEGLANYVLTGGSWTHPVEGAYENPSSVRAVIDLAIEADGRVYEEKILRDPPIGYSLFHLEALSLIAVIAQRHFEAGEVSVWDYRGEDEAGLEEAFDRYVGYIDGSKTSPEPDQESNLTDSVWLYEAPVAYWGKASHRALLTENERNTWIIQAIGPVPLLVGVDP